MNLMQLSVVEKVYIIGDRSVFWFGNSNEKDSVMLMEYHHT